MMQLSNGDRLLKLDEVGEILAVSRRTVHRLIASGELPHPVKVGSGSRMPMLDVLKFTERLKRERT